MSAFHTDPKLEGASCFLAMCTKLRQGYKRCIQAGIPRGHIVFIVRNAANAAGVFDGKGEVLTEIEDAERACSFMLNAALPHEYDIHVVDARNHELVRSLLHHDYDQEEYGYRAMIEKHTYGGPVTRSQTRYTQ